MKKVVLSILMLSGLSLSAQFSNRTMQVNSTMRSYRQYLPSGFNSSTEPNLPLVIALHGLGDNMNNFSGVGFNYVADTARFVVVFPQALPNFVSQNAWNNGTLLGSGADDIGFLNMLIDTMKVKYNIDLSRVYFTGFSMGGIMSYHMLCALPQRIAAIASVAGTMAEPDISSCNPGRAVPVMHMHGTADGTVPYNSNPLPSLSLVPATLSFWQNNNGCSDSIEYNLPNTVPADSITVDTIPYNNCNAPVIHWRENGADHVWLYSPANDIDATTEIWNFFRTKSHPAASQLEIGSEMNDQTIIEYMGSGLHVKSIMPIKEIGIYTMSGQVIKIVTALDVLELTVDLSSYDTQLYIIKVLTSGTIKTKKIVVVN